MKIVVESKGSDGNVANIDIDTSAWLVTDKEMGDIKTVIREQLSISFEQIFDTNKVSVKIYT